MKTYHNSFSAALPLLDNEFDTQDFTDIDYELTHESIIDLNDESYEIA